jgi:hypothetical protein
MPSILLYLTDENYIKWIRLGKAKKKELREKFKDILNREGI